MDVRIFVRKKDIFCHNDRIRPNYKSVIISFICIRYKTILSYIHDMKTISIDSAFTNCINANTIYIGNEHNAINNNDNVFSKVTNNLNANKKS